MRSLIALFFLSVASPAFAATCDAALLGDGVCDCGCGTADPDCPAGSTFKSCERSHCGSGKVPWEHQPASCMTSACGDGWNDPAAGEACDDGNAVASGGCAANCGAVNAGYTCGERAAGCQLAPAASTDAGTNASPDVDSPAPPDAGTRDALDGGTRKDGGTGGCASLPGTPLALAAAAWAFRRRAR